MGKLWLRPLCLGALVAGICFGQLAAQQPDQPPADKKDEKKDDKKEPPPKKEPPKDPIVEGRPLSVWVIQLKDPDAKARQQAAETIAKQRGRAVSVTPAALEMLKDKDAYSR